MPIDEIAHDAGCSGRHTRRQRCDGPVADSRRLDVATAAAAVASPSRTRLNTWEYYPPEALGPMSAAQFRTFARLGGLAELIPGIAILIVWLGSMSESVKWNAFTPLAYIAVLPTLGTFFRGLLGCGATMALWIARVALIVAAIVFWGRANDYGQVLDVDDYPRNYREATYCCSTAWGIGMHLALGGAAATTALSAYAIGWWRLDDELRWREAAEARRRDDR